MKEIKLGYKDYTVTDATYDKIVALVQNERVCKSCQQTYTGENPEVLKNRCLSCVKKSTKLEYIGKHNLLTSLHYCFKDTDGYISTASESAESLSRTVNGTLQYYGFSYPFEWDGKRLYREWSVAGNPATDNCLILEASIEFWNEAKGKYDYKKVMFFSFKNKSWVAINRRKKYIQQLFKQATANLELMKDEKGHYIINGNTFFFLSEHWINTEAAKLADPAQV